MHAFSLWQAAVSYMVKNLGIHNKSQAKLTKSNKFWPDFRVSEQSAVHTGY